jgi:hypothetical protein
MKNNMRSLANERTQSSNKKGRFKETQSSYLESYHFVGPLYDLKIPVSSQVGVKLERDSN